MTVQTYLEVARKNLMMAYTEEQLNSSHSDLAKKIAAFIADLDTLIDIPPALSGEEKMAAIKEETIKHLTSGMPRHTALIKAVKYYRGQTGFGLMESKFAVERIQYELEKKTSGGA